MSINILWIFIPFSFMKKERFFFQGIFSIISKADFACRYFEILAILMILT